MRARLPVLVLVLGLAGAIAVVAAAQSTANGLPSYTNGYQKWPKINKKPIRGGSPAHSGIKNVYASKPKQGKAYPNGTVIVKSVVTPGQAGLPGQVALMRKVKAKWQWDEYSLQGARYSKLSFPQSVCTGCHAGAKSNDWVFTKR